MQNNAPVALPAASARSSASATAKALGLRVMIALMKGL